MKHKAIVIGAIDGGKTTLINALLDKNVVANKTQTLNFHDWIVDTPGEYSENPLHYKNIMATSFQMTHVIFIQSAVTSRPSFPPGFATGIPKLPIGVVTKADLKAADPDLAIEALKKVIPKGPVVITSAVTGQGLKFIKSLVACRTMAEMKQLVEQENNENLLFIS